MKKEGKIVERRLRKKKEGKREVKKSNQFC
jgi:hypothetical protein